MWVFFHCIENVFGCMRIRENGSLSLNDPLTITEKKKEIFAENISKET